MIIGERRRFRTTHLRHLGPARAQRDQLAVLLDALDSVAISDTERLSLTWLAGWERHTTENVAAVIWRARAAGAPAGACLWCGRWCRGTSQRIRLGRRVWDWATRSSDHSTC